jgi:hypothetical protein
VGAAFEVVTGYLTSSAVTAGTYQALAANSPGSYTIRQAAGVVAGEVLTPWAQFYAAGKLQIKTPRWHDTTTCDTYHAQIGTASFGLNPLLGLDDSEPAYSTDILTVQVTTDVTQSVSGTYTAAIPVYYSNLPGVDANLMTWPQVQSYINYGNKDGLHYINYCSPSSAATYGQIGAGTLINATNDQYKAGHFYALLGYQVSASCAAVLFSGTDTGNLYLGGPGTLDTDVTKNWFVDLSNAQNLPLIPVIQANNKGTTYVYIVDGNTESTSFIVSLHFMDLGVLVAPPGV